MKTSIYVTELSFIRPRLVEDTSPTVIVPEKNTGPDPGPNPATAAKEKPAPSEATKKTTPAPEKKSSVEKQAFIGGALSDVGSQILQKVYGVVSGDIYHKPQGRVGNNPAYTGSGYNR